MRGGEDLLDFLAAGEMGQDAGAFDRGAALEMQAGGPVFLCGVVGGSVASAEVEGADFVGLVRRVRWCVEEFASVGLKTGVGQHAVEGESESAHRMSGVEFVFEVALVEDIAFGFLDDEQNACGMRGR